MPALAESASGKLMEPPIPTNADQMPSGFVRRLATGGSAEEIGRKAQRLAELYRNGFRVAPGFVVLASAFDAFLEANATSSHEEVTTRSQLPDEVVSEARTSFIREIGPDNEAVVRSSATHEDAPTVSFAGVFASQLNVGVNDLPDALRAVLASAFRPEVADYAASQGLEASHVKMAVLVQRQIDPWLSGVAFTRNPVTGEPHVVVEFVEGHSQDLLAGRASPAARLAFDEDLHEISGTTVADEQLRALARVAETAHSVERACGAPQDVEWAVDRHGGVFILQSRDITALPTGAQDRGRSESAATTGVGLSPGEGVGPARKVLAELEPAELDRLVTAGDVVLAHALRIDHLGVLARAAGVVTADASLLSHVAIRTRELGIPCVGGVADVLARFRDGQSLRVDGRRGLVSTEDDGHGPSGATPTRPPPVSYYDPDRVESLTADGRTIVYEPRPDHAIVFLRRMGSAEERETARAALSEQLGIPPEKIEFDDQAAWEWGNSPSVVYSQYHTIEALRADTETVPLLATAVDLLNRHDAADLRQLIEDVDRAATAAIHQAESKLREYTRTGDRERVEEAAESIGRARKLSGDLVGIAIIDVFGSRALEHAATRLVPAGLSTGGILGAATSESAARTARSRLHGEDQRSIFDSAVGLARLLVEAKNRRLDVERTPDNTVVDLINWLVELGFADIVERYGW